MLCNCLQPFGGLTLHLYCKTFIKLEAECPTIIVIYRKLDSTVPRLNGVPKSFTNFKYFNLILQSRHFVCKAIHHTKMQLTTAA